MKRVQVLIIGSLLVATAFGIYGQHVSYFIGDHVAYTNPVYCLTLLTVISLLLYGLTPVFTFVYARKLFVPYLLANGLLGVPVSFFSLFVLAMWWG